MTSLLIRELFNIYFIMGGSLAKRFSIGTEKMYRVLPADMQFFFQLIIKIGVSWQFCLMASTDLVSTFQGLPGSVIYTIQDKLNDHTGVTIDRRHM